MGASIHSSSVFELVGLTCHYWGKAGAPGWAMTGGGKPLILVHALSRTFSLGDYPMTSEIEHTRATVAHLHHNDPMRELLTRLAS